MTKVNFTACFEAEFDYGEGTLLTFDNNVFNKLDEDGEPIELKGPDGNPEKDENGETLYVTYKKSAKNVLDNFILSDTVLGGAGFFESNIVTEDQNIYEYEANLFDFKDVNDDNYDEVVETAANALITTIYNKYSNVRVYTVGKYVAGNSFGIKLVFIIF